jgi:hypothetical protein
MLNCFAYVLHPHLLSQSNTDVPVLQAEVTQAREAITDAEAARAAAVLVIEVSTHEATTAWNPFVSMMWRTMAL